MSTAQRIIRAKIVTSARPRAPVAASARPRALVSSERQSASVSARAHVVSHSIRLNTGARGAVGGTSQIEVFVNPVTTPAYPAIAFVQLPGGMYKMQVNIP